jgi:hypothetical protein
VNQFRKAAGTDPEALQVVSDRNKITSIFACTAGKTVDGDVFLFWLSFCFFSVKFYSVSFFYRECTFRTDADAKSHSITKFFRYDFCLSIDNFKGTFGTGRNTFSAACTLFFINFYYHPFYHLTDLFQDLPVKNVLFCCWENAKNQKYLSEVSSNIRQVSFFV